MIIRALAPLTITSKKRGSRDLIPGETIELPDSVARQLLEKAKGKVRMVNPDWLTAWRYLAAATHGLEESDPRFQPIITLLEQCDEAFLCNNWVAFQELSRKVHQILREGN